MDLTSLVFNSSSGLAVSISTLGQGTLQVDLYDGSITSTDYSATTTTNCSYNSCWALFSTAGVCNSKKTLWYARVSGIPESTVNGMSFSLSVAVALDAGNIFGCPSISFNFKVFWYIGLAIVGTCILVCLICCIPKCLNRRRKGYVAIDSHNHGHHHHANTNSHSTYQQPPQGAGPYSSTPNTVYATPPPPPYQP